MHNKRLKKLRYAMREKRLPALFVTSPQNVAYLSGFRGHASSDILVPCLTDPEVVMCITPRTSYTIADRRYAKQAIYKMCRSLQNVHRHIVIEKSIFETMRSLCEQLHIKKIGVEYDALRATDLHTLQKTFGGIKIIDASLCIPALRREKDAQEITALAEACRVTDNAFTALLQFIRIGMTEGEVAHFLVNFFHRHADGPAFTPIVASGKGAAIPHYGTSKTKKIRRGEMLLLDFGARVGGYHADMTRTIFLGKATTRFRKVYALVLAAQKCALTSLSTPGVESKTVDEEVRNTFRGAGVEKFFLHSTGHGVGLQIHEAPRLSPLSKDIMKVNHVFTVEPGLYFPSWGGVRIEDTVFLTSKGPRILMRSSKKLIEIH